MDIQCFTCHENLVMPNQIIQTLRERLYQLFGARSFLLGRKFKLVSDHMPLQFLFNPNRALQKVTFARIQRWALHMAAFN